MMIPNDANESRDRIDATLREVAGFISTHRLDSARRLLADLVSTDEPMSDLQRCRVLLEWGWLHGASQQYEISRQALAMAAQLARTFDSRQVLCEVLRESAVVARYQGDFDEADRHLVEAETEARREDNQHELGRTLFLRATVAHHRNSFTQVRELLAGAAAGSTPVSGMPASAGSSVWPMCTANWAVSPNNSVMRTRRDTGIARPSPSI
jgi:hypothetical protein